MIRDRCLLSLGTAGYRRCAEAREGIVFVFWDVH